MNKRLSISALVALAALATLAFVWASTREPKVELTVELGDYVRGLEYEPIPSGRAKLRNVGYVSVRYLGFGSAKEIRTHYCGPVSDHIPVEGSRLDASDPIWRTLAPGHWAWFTFSAESPTEPYQVGTDIMDRHGNTFVVWSQPFTFRTDKNAEQ